MAARELFMQDQWRPELYYHIIGKAVEGQTLFRDEEDCKWFLRHVVRFKWYTFFEVLAYCLCGNHFHLAVRTRHAHDAYALLRARPPRSYSESDFLFLDEELGYTEWVYQSFGGALSGLARRLNGKYGRSGQLLQKPTLHGLTDKGLPGVELSRRLVAYVGLNYIKHRMGRFEEAYPWSSVHGEHYKIIEHDTLLAGFGGRDGYVEYHRDYLGRYGQRFMEFDEERLFASLQPRLLDEASGRWVEGEWRPGELLY